MCNEKEMVNHPEHYNKTKYETIKEMEILFGKDAVKTFCKLTAYKYKSRAMFKGNADEDLKKADWYLKYLYDLECEDDDGWIC